MPHTGEYRTPGLTEAEARCFDLTLHADMFKPAFHVTANRVFDAYLKAIKIQGSEIKAVTDLLFKYYGPRHTVNIREGTQQAGRCGEWSPTIYFNYLCAYE